MSKYILSCDCATHIFGWAIIDKENFTLVDYGEIKCDNEDVMYRTNYMVDELQKIIKKYKAHIESAVVEDVPRSKVKVDTTVVLSKLNGAVLYLLHKYDIPTKLIYPSTWHSKLDIKTSKGDVKKQSIEWVNKKYNTDFKYYSKSSKKNQDNITDPIAMACVVLGNYDKMLKFGRKESKI
jgi:Holliday junction resolvasome RuvABC endonuclease subunit